MSSDSVTRHLGQTKGTIFFFSTTNNINKIKRQ